MGERLVPWRFELLVIVAVTWGAGCSATRTFRPTTPVSNAAAGGPATLEVAWVQRGGGLVVYLPDGPQTTSGTTVGLRWRAEKDGGGIARAYLAPPEVPACTAGLRAELIDVDGQTRWDRPVGLGRAHDVTLAFPGDERFDRGPLVLDVEVTGDHAPECVRLPLARAGQGWAAVSKLALASYFGFATPLRSASTVMARVDGAVGRWLGPVRLTLRLGMGFGVGAANVNSGGSDDSAKPRFFDLHAAPELTFFPVVHGRFVLGISAALEGGVSVWGAGTMTDPDGDTDYWGPRLGVILASAPATIPGAPTHMPLAGRGVELFVARPTSWPRDVGRGATYVIGLGGMMW